MIKKEVEIDTLARTLWGEARGEGKEGMEAVAAVIVNRVNDDRWPSSFSGVCKQPWQFSCWNENDPNLPKLKAVTKEDEVFVVALEVARKAVNGQLLNLLGGANHYFTTGLAPKWANNMRTVAVTGGHKFMIG